MLVIHLTEQYAIYLWATLVLQPNFVSSYTEVQGGQSGSFGQVYAHQGRFGWTELRCWSIKLVDGSEKIANQTDVHQVTSSRSKSADMARYTSRSDVSIGENIFTMCCPRVSLQMSGKVDQ